MQALCMMAADAGGPSCTWRHGWRQRGARPAAPSGAAAAQSQRRRAHAFLRIPSHPEFNATPGARSQSHGKSAPMTNLTSFRATSSEEEPHRGDLAHFWWDAIHCSPIKAPACRAHALVGAMHVLKVACSQAGGAQPCGLITRPGFGARPGWCDTRAQCRLPPGWRCAPAALPARPCPSARWGACARPLWPPTRLLRSTGRPQPPSPRARPVAAAAHMNPKHRHAAVLNSEALRSTSCRLVVNRVVTRPEAVTGSRVPGLACWESCMHFVLGCNMPFGLRQGGVAHPGSRGQHVGETCTRKSGPEGQPPGVTSASPRPSGL